MEFTNSFTVDAPLSVVWDFLLDAQEVAPCVPGAEITEFVDDRHFRGMVKVKLGPVQMTYRGELELEADETNRTITLRAKGTETRGSGGASGTFTNRLSEQGGQTEVQIQTQVDVTGRAAQFGRGIMQDVANRLIRQFAQCLEERIAARGAVGTGSPTEPPIVPMADPAPPPPAQTAPSSTTSSGTSASAPPTPTAPVSAAGTELRVSQLLLDALRARLAAALRGLANLVEP